MNNGKKDPKRKLGEVLLEMGLIKRNDLDKALALQKEDKKRLGNILLEMKTITEKGLALAMASQLGHLGISYIDLANTPIELEVIKVITEKVAKQCLSVPIKLENKVLTVAMADPLDLNSINTLRFISGYNVKPAITTTSEILAAMKRYYYPDESIYDLAQNIIQEAEFQVIPESDTEEEEEVNLEDSPFVRMVDVIIVDAINKRASDIHIEPEENLVTVRNRIDGLLKESIKVPKWAQLILTSRIKVMANLDITEKRIPQDGRIRIIRKDKEVDLRVSTLPTKHGEKVVIRILDKSQTLKSLENLGFCEKNYQKISKFIKKPQGLILVTGPTGSGKTSTLYSCLREIKSNNINIITVEDPIEYDLEGINQVQINDRVNLSFTNALRSILRQDPDVIMVGEIRDRKTAEIAIQAAQTGHLVLSTLHTKNAPATVTRLLNMGIPPYLAATSIIGIIAQRLCPLICTHCKESYIPSDQSISRLKMNYKNLPIKFYHGKGCKLCGDMGYFGRTCISEVMEFNMIIRDLIQAGVSEDTIRETAIAMGMTTLGDEGIEKVKEGKIDIEHFLRAVEEEEELASICPYCFKSININFRACPYCKRSVTLTCTSCNKLLQGEWVACPYCRQDIEKPGWRSTTPPV